MESFQSLFLDIAESMVIFVDPTVMYHLFLTIPPRTAIAGLLGAILGVKKEKVSETLLRIN